MLIGFWYALTAGGLIGSGIGILRLVRDEMRADGSDAFTFFVSLLLMFVSAVTAANLEVSCYTCSTGLAPYTGFWYFMWPFVAIGTIDIGLFFVAIMKSIQIKDMKKSFIDVPE